MRKWSVRPPLVSPSLIAAMFALVSAVQAIGERRFRVTYFEPTWPLDSALRAQSSGYC